MTGEYAESAAREYLLWYVGLSAVGRYEAELARSELSAKVLKSLVDEGKVVLRDGKYYLAEKEAVRPPESRRWVGAGRRRHAASRPMRGLPRLLFSTAPDGRRKGSTEIWTHSLSW